MNSPLIFLHETQELSFSLNPKEKTHGFVHPWWEDPRSAHGDVLLQPHSNYQENGLEKQETLTKVAETAQEKLQGSSLDRHGIEEGRTFILLFSVVFFIFIILILIFWIKRMKNTQVNNNMMKMILNVFSFPTYRNVKKVSAMGLLLTKIQQLK